MEKQKAEVVNFGFFESDSKKHFMDVPLILN